MSTKVVSGDCVTLSDGSRVREFVVLSFTRHHINLAPKSLYEHSIEKYGEYRTMLGYHTMPLVATIVHTGFWELLKSVNGVDVENK